VYAVFQHVSNKKTAVNIKTLKNVKTSHELEKLHVWRTIHFTLPAWYCVFCTV